MATAKDIVVKVIPSRVGIPFVKRYHYSGKVTNNSVLYMGVFLNDVLHGVASFGQGIDKRKTINLVHDTGWNDYLELNRMAFDGDLPKNSESRFIAIAIRMLKKKAPHIRWLLSYADATQCGDGAIYRAAGFYLTQIKQNNSMWRLPDGNVVCKLVFEASFGGTQSGIKARYGKVGDKASWTANKFLDHIGAEMLPGYQLRYIYLIDKTARLNCPVIPYSKIDEIGAGMYKGVKVSVSERQSGYKKQESDSYHQST